MTGLLSKFLRPLGSLATIAICISGIILIQSQQLEELTQEQTLALTQLQEQEEKEKHWLQIVSKLPTFGFDNLMADWVFLRFLQYFGDDAARSQTGYALSPEYFELIVERDPKFLDSYVFLSASVSIYAGMPSRTVTILNKGLESMTPQIPFHSYYVWRYKAIDELLFLGDSKSAKKSFEIAAEWADNYRDEESKYVAEGSRSTAKFLEKNFDSKKAQVNAWTMVLTNAIDDDTRKLAVSKIEELGGQVIINSNGGFSIIPPEDD